MAGKRFPIAAASPWSSVVHGPQQQCPFEWSQRNSQSFNPGKGKYTITLDEAMENGRRDVKAEDNLRPNRRMKIRAVNGGE